APPADFNGTVSFDFVANDGTTDSNTGTVTIEVNAANDAPVASNDAQSVDEDGTLNGSVAGLAQDADGEDLSFALVGAPIAGLTFNGDGSYSYAPPADFNGTVSFDFVANDGTTDSNTGTVTIEVNAVNDAPVASNTTLHIPEDGSTSGNLADLVSDPDGGTLSFIQIGSNPNVTLNSDGTWSYTAIPNYTGPDSFQYQAFDGTASSNIATVTIDIDFENDAPTDIALSNASIAENSPAGALVGLLSATDVDSAAFTYAIVSGPSPFAIVGNQLQVNGALDYETQDTYTLTIRVDDGAGGTYDEDFVIAVTDQDETPDNSAPEAGDDSVAAAEDGTTVLAGLLSNDTDADSDSLAIAAVTQPAKGSVSLVGGQVVFDAAGDFEGLDDGESEDVTFGYTVSDGKGGTDTATVTVTVNGANDAPVASNDAQSVDEDGTLNGSVAGLAQDADGEDLSFALVGA
ncbi:Ig-like domain-containing protein, partial [Roseomonas sp. AR75]|uniref:Ig-like domain-containing protein n=1 Tax=Roseomonas sp. AR75 TaxID=2562311 RepID=UPI0010C09CBC